MHAIPEFPHCKFLLVDPDPLGRKALARALRPLTRHIFCAERSDDARLVLRRHWIDLLVCEADRSCGDHLALLREGRRSHPAMRAFILSGNPAPELVALATRERLIERLVDKPWDGAELLALIRAALAAPNRLESNLAL